MPASPGNCALAGSYIDGHGQQQVFVIDEVNGDWISPRAVKGLADLCANGTGAGGAAAISVVIMAVPVAKVTHSFG